MTNTYCPRCKFTRASDDAILRITTNAWDHPLICDDCWVVDQV